MPPYPAWLPGHDSSAPTPSGLTSPTPVTTTRRRCLWLNACRISLALSLDLDLQRWERTLRRTGPSACEGICRVLIPCPLLTSNWRTTLTAISHLNVTVSRPAAETLRKSDYEKSGHRTKVNGFKAHITRALIPLTSYGHQVRGVKDDARISHTTDSELTLIHKLPRDSAAPNMWQHC